MIIRRLSMFLLLAILLGCDSDDARPEMVIVAFPEKLTLTEFRSSVEIQSPKPISKAGKIYAFSNYIFINDSFKGIHIIDNTDPASPVAISYIKIPGNEDISVKDNYLYADSAVDLLVFDISDISRITMVERLENVFSVYDYVIPTEAEFTDFNSVDFDNEIIVGWDLQERRRDEYIDDNSEIDVFTLSESGNVGQGGSLARFQIVEDFLYTVSTSSMSVFNIENLNQPNLVNEQYAGWRIETMFHADGYLYLGGENGMYIYDMVEPSSPSLVSEFIHWEGCDPVVVDGDYAYLTLRGGNLCGQDESVLEVINIEDKSNPILTKRYTLDNPYGLGFRNDLLFICDGDAGLKVFNKSNPEELIFIKGFEDVFAKDVIPLQDVLLMIGDNILFQYRYEDGNLQLLSTLNLN